MQAEAGESLKILGLENQLYNITREKEKLEHKHNLELIKLKGKLECAQIDRDFLQSDNNFLKFCAVFFGVLAIIQFLLLVFVAVKFSLI